jgi:hypothetical protein
MKYGKWLYQHSFLDKQIPVKWNMQAKPQLVQCKSFHAPWRYFCQNKFCKSSRYFVLFVHISVVLKERNFDENHKSTVHLIISSIVLKLQCICTMKVNIYYMLYSLTVAVQVSPCVSNFVCVIYRLIILRQLINCLF